jgi:phytanoyl-CoA dioxygenase PhyH
VPLWLDDPDAARAIEEKLRAGEITEAEAESLRSYSEEGYFVTAIDLSIDDAEAIDGDVNRLWSDRPANVTLTCDSPPRRFSDAHAAQHRRPRYRIQDLHSVSDVAMDLYLHPALNRYASLIIGEPAVAVQSLYFEYGSQQTLHRDSIVAPALQLGVWIALEEIDPGSGPLVYVPKSHRLPFFHFSTGEPTYDPFRVTAAEVEAAIEFYEKERHRNGLSERQFLPSRGGVLVWHSDLMHGGAHPSDEWRSRKSLAVHYASLRAHATRECAVREMIDGLDGESVFSTSALHDRNGIKGFMNPLDGAFLYRRYDSICG